MLPIADPTHFEEPALIGCNGRRGADILAPKWIEMCKNLFNR